MWIYVACFNKQVDGPILEQNKVRHESKTENDGNKQRVRRVSSRHRKRDGHAMLIKVAPCDRAKKDWATDWAFIT